MLPDELNITLVENNSTERYLTLPPNTLPPKRRIQEELGHLNLAMLAGGISSIVVECRDQEVKC